MVGLHEYNVTKSPSKAYTVIYLVKGYTVIYLVKLPWKLVVSQFYFLEEIAAYENPE